MDTGPLGFPACTDGCYDIAQALADVKPRIMIAVPLVIT